MLAAHTSPKPASRLRLQGAGLKVRINPNAFGNALGSSLAGSNVSGSATREHDSPFANIGNEIGTYNGLTGQQALDSLGPINVASYESIGQSTYGLGELRAAGLNVTQSSRFWMSPEEENGIAPRMGDTEPVNDEIDPSLQQVPIIGHRMTQEEREASFEVDREMNRFEALQESMRAAPIRPGPIQVPTTRLGNLSMKYETRMAPSEYRKAAGVVSSGKGDPGGISYGAYQLASNVGKVQAFLKNNGAPWASRFAGMDPTIVGNFGKTWKAIAALPSDDFFNAQHTYIKESNFDPVVQYLRKKTGLDIMTQPLAVQDAVWSASVQHGGARTFLKDAIDSVQENRTSPGYPDMLLNAIYEKRIDYVNTVKMDTTTKSNLVNIRYPDELSRALQMLKK